MPRRRSGAERLRSALLWWTGIALAVLIWHAAARTQPEYVLPSAAAPERRAAAAPSGSASPA